MTKFVSCRPFSNLNKTEKSDFIIIPMGRGHYKVTYQSPKTGKQWTSVINDTLIIDAVMHEEEPKRKDLNRLKAICKEKNGGKL